MKNTILLIEDDHRLRRILQLVLEGAGHKVLTAADGREGIAILQIQRPDAVLTDLKMEPVDGLAVLAFAKKHIPLTPIIMLTAFGTVQTAVLAMKDGAFDYLTKPVDNNELLLTIEEALSTRPPHAKDTKELIGPSKAMEKVRHNIQIFAASDSSVLISGESGTGKELAARGIHKASAHPNGPFIRVNCAAIPAELIESELFGHTQGAFTGANNNRVGAFNKADGGTIFLDEIGDLPLAMQPKLLHAVDEKTVTPVGSNTEKAIKIKILSASNRNLAEMISEKAFRQDLYYRLNRVHLHMPSVREREGDVIVLLDHFLQLFCRKLGREQLIFTPKSMELLSQYPWPGNVRELKNVVERAILCCDREEKITPAYLPSFINTNVHLQESQDIRTSTNLCDQEQKLIITVLQDCKWNQSKAARALGITRNTLRYRIQKHGINNT